MVDTSWAVWGNVIAAGSIVKRKLSVKIFLLISAWRIQEKKRKARDTYMEY